MADAVRAIREKARLLGLPRFWRQDLDRDERFLRRWRPQRFLWIAWRCGTFLIPLDPGVGREGDVALARRVLAFLAHEGPGALEARCFLWDGSTLREVSLAIARAEVARFARAASRRG